MTELDKISSTDRVLSNSRSKVDLNNLITKLKKKKRDYKSQTKNIVISAAALSAVFLEL